MRISEILREGALRSRIEALSFGMRSGRLSPVDVFRETRFKQGYSKNQGILVEPLGQTSLVQARSSEKRYLNDEQFGLLDGIPFGVKDLIDVEGCTTSRGSLLYRNAPPAKRNAEAVERLGFQGMVFGGKTNLSELAFSGVGTNDLFGSPINPRATTGKYITGGSSSGSAAGVASGLWPVSLGTDTSGSSRIPAAFCGVVGFKPSFDRYPLRGVAPLAPSLDHLGINALTVQDCIILDQALRGLAPIPKFRMLSEQTEFLVPRNKSIQPRDPHIKDNFDKTLDLLSNLGFEIHEVDFSPYAEVDRLFEIHGSLVAHEAAQQYEALFENGLTSYIDPKILQRLKEGTLLNPKSYALLQKIRRNLRAELSSSLGNKILLQPTVRILPPAIESVLQGVDEFKAFNKLILGNTMYANYLGMPAIAIPNGHAPNGFSTSIQLSAASGKDDFLLKTALFLEAALSKQNIYTPDTVSH